MEDLELVYDGGFEQLWVIGVKENLEIFYRFFMERLWKLRRNDILL
jgi:hypothetical protein